MGVTLPVGGSKDHLLRIKGFNPEEVAIGDRAEELPVPLAHKETRPTESFLFLVNIAFVLDKPEKTSPKRMQIGLVTCGTPVKTNAGQYA